MMTQKIKLKIGEFSKLNQVSVKTLRHYEEIGLLIPFQIDEWTGYRYYDVTQLKAMNKIIYLKKLGFTLDEIKDVFEEGSYFPAPEMIESKLNSCKKEQQLLKWREQELISLKNRIKEREKMETIIIKSLPAIIVACHRRIISNYQELFSLCPNIIGPEMMRLGCECPEPGYCFTIDHNKEYKETEIDIEYCEQVLQKRENSELISFREMAAVPKAVCFNHYGTYDKLPQSWSKLYEYLESNGYKIIDSPRFCYIDGIWNKENEDEWLTEIQVPVK